MVEDPEVLRRAAGWLLAACWAHAGCALFIGFCSAGLTVELDLMIFWPAKGGFKPRAAQVLWLAQAAPSGWDLACLLHLEAVRIQGMMSVSQCVAGIKMVQDKREPIRGTLY